jgi:hypothetical protein
MKTPEARAYEVLNKPLDTNKTMAEMSDQLARNIADAIRDAVADERASCAQLCKDQCLEHDEATQIGCAVICACFACANAIRKRGSE